MKAKEIRERSDDELRKALSDLEEQLFKLRFQKSTGQIENPIKIREVRKDIARIKNDTGQTLPAGTVCVNGVISKLFAIGMSSAVALTSSIDCSPKNSAAESINENGAAFTVAAPTVNSRPQTASNVCFNRNLLIFS